MSLCTAFIKGTQASAAAPSSTGELLRFQQRGFAKGLLPGRVLQRFDEQIFGKDWVTVLKTVEVPQLQFIVGLGMHQIETVQKTVEAPQLPSRLGFVQFWTRLSIGSLAGVFPQCKLCRRLARSHRCCSWTWL